MNATASYIHCLTCGTQTIHTFRGCCYHPRELTTRPQESATRAVTRPRGRPRSYGLTAREIEIAAHLGRGLRQVDVAEIIGWKRGSIAGVLKRARERVGVETTLQLINYARKQEQPCK